jgi:hypothetical protein
MGSLSVQFAMWDALPVRDSFPGVPSGYLFACSPPSVLFRHEGRGMNIGIIGAGKVGVNPSGAASQGGYKVAISNSRGPESLKEIVQDLGPNVVAATPTRRPPSGGRHRAIPYGASRSCPGNARRQGCRERPQTTTRSATATSTRRLTQTELLAQHLSGSKVVKAFKHRLLGALA